MGFFTTALTAISAIQGIRSGQENSDRANSLAGAQIELGEQQLDFAKTKYNDWKTIYGPIEQNLADFYEGVTPQYFESQGLESFNKEFARTRKELNEFFAINDISSGVAADIRGEQNLEAAKIRAGIRLEAPFKAAESKLGFLQIGLGQQSSHLSSITNATNNLSSILGSQASIAADSANIGFEAAATGLETLADQADLALDRD